MWFNKKKEENKSKLPQLPSLPELPELPQLPESSIQQTEQFLPPPIKEDINSLPTFPNSETANKMSREAIKSALNTKSKPYIQEIDSSGQEEAQKTERSAWGERGVEERRAFEEGEEETEAFNSVIPLPRQSENQPIFVRIDKFQAAVRNIHETKKQISEIESCLAEIKKIKAKEEQEIQEWEHEILETKNKLENVDKTLFSKLD